MHGKGHGRWKGCKQIMWPIYIFLVDLSVILLNPI